MAIGLHKLTGSDVCVSLTGLAGPDGDGINPVGLICFGFMIGNEAYTLKEVFKGNRNEIRTQGMRFVFEELNKKLWKREPY